ncbi:MAG: hypothetical protein R3F56_07725 [Planctomycetota bacterium]
MRSDSTRCVCFLSAGLLYGAGGMGVAHALGAQVKINIALMLLACATGFLVAGIVMMVRPRTSP